ncbi:MAG TPA: helix-turn-helix transcriptional regulator [Sunxiuqinia sp.]|nr:helix-turn-helix transcriptional regulator [Sunxiuqinia sp.]
MNIRIKQFMDHKGISASELADTIGVQRSNVTHVLHGRNKPSFQFIAKLLETYPEINAKWLIMGSGIMLENGELSQPQQHLFEKSTPVTKPETATPEQEEQSADQPTLSSFNLPSPAQEPYKKIEKIVVFYTDRTFKEYDPAK